MRLEGKTAVVTGGGAGNGRAMAVRFAQEGANVVVSDLDEAGLAETVRLVEQEQRSGAAVVANATSRDDTLLLIDTAVERYGSVDVMVANAGITNSAPFLDMDDATWQSVIDVNLTGVFLSTQLAARQMVAQGRGGAIINIASIMAIQGAGGASNYCAAKAGVVSLTKSAALALAPHGIRVNGIGPGFIETAMTAVLREESAMRHNLLQQTPMNAFGEPLDVANAALFLACDESKFMTGQTLFPDGGYLLNYVAPSPELIETQMRLAADASG
ncbi:MAG: glucose 1-dehydrogenase [Candidatus Poriferisodalaceae bacterium]|jgi:glucose 1-dehydrogenase